MYYSPCYAGCYRETPMNDVKVSFVARLRV